MGLDMYFTAYPKDKTWEDTDKDGNTYGEELYYFRKHSDLNGLLQSIWLHDNPTQSAEDFNCTHMVITKDIVKEIERVAYLSEGRRQKYTGFFWGQSYEEDWKETRLKAIPLIKEALREGKTVIYHPWW